MYELFRNILALPLYYINIGRMEPESDNFDGIFRIPKDSDLRMKGFFAGEVYRVVISGYSLYTFMALSILTLLWCAGSLLYCWIYAPLVPNISAFLEINFCTKLDVEMQGVLSGLGNAQSRDVEKKVRKTRVLVGSKEIETQVGLEGAVILSSCEMVRRLNARK